MRILMVHNRYLYRAGEDQSFDARLALLRQRGHMVDTYVEDNARVARLGALRTAERTVWSREAFNEVRQRLRARRYDLLDVHNTFPLISPAVYYAARAESVPVIQTLHNYRLLCPKATFYRNGGVCEDCLGRAVPWPAVLHACYRGSHAGSAVVSTMLTAHRALGTWKWATEAYIAVSDFARRKFVEGGLPAAKIVVARHFVDPDPGEGLHRGGYALFVGRLAPEKGIATLLAAWERLGDRVPLRIVGDGPLADQVAAAAARRPGLKWLGTQAPADVRRLMGDAAVLVVPSEWYETFGLVAIEAFARGTPVIGSNIGALAEVVEHGRTGLLFPTGRADALAEVVRGVWTGSPDELATMARQARRRYETTYTAEHAYQDLWRGYMQALGRWGGGTGEALDLT